MKHFKDDFQQWFSMIVSRDFIQKDPIIFENSLWETYLNGISQRLFWRFEKYLRKIQLFENDLKKWVNELFSKIVLKECSQRLLSRLILNGTFWEFRKMTSKNNWMMSIFEAQFIGSIYWAQFIGSIYWAPITPPLQSEDCFGGIIGCSFSQDS